MQFKSILTIGALTVAASAAAVPDSDIVAPFAIVNVYPQKACAGTTTAFRENKGQSGCFPYRGKSLQARGYDCKITAWTGDNCNGPVGDVVKQDDTCIDYAYNSIQIQC